MKIIIVRNNINKQSEKKRNGFRKIFRRSLHRPNEGASTHPQPGTHGSEEHPRGGPPVIRLQPHI
jgi:hypothetical protein